MGSKVIIVGAGPGGLTAGMILAHNGYEVEIYEKRERVGGRNGAIQEKGFTFDIGPTFLMLAEVLEEVFKLAGRNVREQLDVQRLDPLYRLNFDGKRNFYPSSNREKMLKELQRVFPEDVQGYSRFMKYHEGKFKRLYGCLKLPYNRFYHLFRKKLLFALPDLGINRSLHQELSRYFNTDDLKIAMTFQSKYLGMSPWKCPGGFTIIPFIEHEFGIHHVTGGLNRISEVMAMNIQEDGGKIRLNTPVKEILKENGRATGVLLESGERAMADAVIINADFSSAMKNLIPESKRRKFKDQRLNKMEYSCSTYMIYLGLDKLYDIPHHNIFFANDYKKNVDEIADKKVLSMDPSFYIHNPSKLDPTLAPEGKSALYILVPVPNNKSEIDWNREKDGFRRLILDKIREKTELKDLEDHIEFEKIITPIDWQDEYDVFLGATFNISHSINQMLYFRPHNDSEEMKDLYIVGGGTHPGSGLPTIYESANISSHMIMKNIR